jgi:hypothetical protein
MRKLLAWLGVATLSVLWSATAHAQGSTLKPYVVLALDTSGSMSGPTNSGPPSCGGADTKLDHARCAINNIANSYGDMVFALAEFRSSHTGTVAGTCPGGCAMAQTGCTITDERFELLTPLVDGNNADAARWTDFSCGTCDTTLANNPELWNAAGATPLEGTLKGAKRYYQGLQASDGTVIWPALTPGFDPITADSTNGVFLNPPGHTTCDATASCVGANCCISQCRPYIVIMLTDGDETCGGTPASVAAAAASMLSTTPHNDAIGITSVTRAANVVTITTYVNHAFVVGDTVTISGVTPATFNGTFTVTAVPTATTFRYAQTAANVAATATTGTASRPGALKYRIQTKPIGFGITGPYQPIEDIAHGGGAVDIGGNAVLEGYYAADEAGLELAISSIIEGSVRSESCNGLDDDCDGQADEDFKPPAMSPGLGDVCTNGQFGACLRAGTLVCRADGTGVQCNAPAVTPGVEICNNMDDDCDGKIDEDPDPPALPINCQPCVPTGESCNGKDDNCNGQTDENLTRACGTGACLGTETCVGGAYVGCTARVPTTETCNGIDDDCDGIRDGFTLACSNMVTPGGPATDNPGEASHNPIPENICKPGTKTCPVVASPPNSFSACTGEIKPCNGLVPCVDGCNNVDDDCDNLIDEDFVPANCSSSCGIGQTSCVAGVITCNAMPAATDDTCNGIDDNCNGQIDEGWVPPNPNTCSSGLVCNGVNECVNGMVVCVGNPIGQETCNCLDDDCDGTVDNNVTCPAGSACTSCECAFPCDTSEFPCPTAKKCVGGACISDHCYGFPCPDVGGVKQVCVEGAAPARDPMCVDVCSTVTCPVTTPPAPTLICIPSTGECKPDDCTTFPNLCTTNQVCIVDSATGAGTCVTNLCAGVTCGTDQYCVAGQCYGSCADVDCPTGQRCRLGTCETDPCGHPCPYGKACHDSTGQCTDDPCQGSACPQGQWCNPNNNGACEPDPCVGTMCPSADQVCKGGTCYDPTDFLPDAGVEQHVTVGGGGCSTSGGGSGVGLLIGLALLAVRRRRVA